MYGIKNIVDVTLKSLTTGKPALYLETLKMSSTEVKAASEVSARGGRGNPKHLTWQGDKEVAFTAQDALISPEGLAILIGNSASTGAVAVHKKETLTAVSSTGIKVTLAETPTVGKSIFVFKTTDGISIGEEIVVTTGYTIAGKEITFPADVLEGDMVIVDYYYTSSATAKTVKVTAKDFPGYYSLEGYTTWTDKTTGAEVVALYTMPKVKLKPDFKLDQAAEGDPSVFDFNMDVFPDANNDMVVITILE